MCCVNFVWGILIFREPVADFFSTVCAFLCLGLGLIGMSTFSSASHQAKVKDLPAADKSQKQEEDGLLEMSSSRRRDSQEIVPLTADVRRRGEVGDDDDQNEITIAETSKHGVDDAPEVAGVVLFGKVMVSSRIAGILAAVFNGVMAGSSLIPLHYAKQHGFGGASYLISFSVGAAIATAFLWSLLFFYHFVQHYNGARRAEPTTANKMFALNTGISKAVESMPPVHVRKIFIPAFTSGTSTRVVVKSAPKAAYLLTDDLVTLSKIFQVYSSQFLCFAV